MIAVWWKVFINDRELKQTEKSCVNGLTFSNPINGSDTVTLEISDPDMIFIEDNIYTDNTPVTVRWGIYGTLFTQEFKGYISAIDIDFPTDDVVTLTVTAMDKSHVMHRAKKKRSWENTTRSAVVQQIAKEYGFNCVVESGYNFKQEETISQDNKTDLEFIEGLADEEDEKFYCKLIGDTIYYCKQGLLNDPVVNLTYRKYPFDLLSFKPQITIEDKKEEESTSDINSSSLAPSTCTVNSNTASRNVQGSSTPASRSSSRSSSNSSSGSSSSSSSSSSSGSGGRHVFDPATRTWS